MGSSLTTLRSLLEDQLNTGTTSNATDPTSTLLNSYINKGIRRIARLDQPRELLAAAPSSVDITENTNTVSVPSTLIVPQLVYYQNSSGTFTRMTTKDIKSMIDIEGPNNFFDTTNTGDPGYYAIRGTSILFNKYFSRSATGAVKVYGLTAPSTLSSDSDETELPTDYDMLITYEAAVYFYQRDDDLQNQLKFQGLAQQERNELRLFLDTNDEKIITLDPSVFTSYAKDIGDPSVFFQ